MLEVTSTQPLEESALLSIHTDRSSEFICSLSTVEISSSKFDLSSSLDDILAIHFMPPLEASLNVPDSPHSPPSQPPPEHTQVDAVSAPLEASLNVLAPPHSTPPQRPLGVTPVDPRSSLLDLALAPTSLTLSQEGSLENEVSSTPAPRPSFTLHPPHSSLSSSVNVNFEFTFDTLTVLISALFVVSVIIPTYSRKLQSKDEDISNYRNSITGMQGNAFDIAQLFQLAQCMPHAARLVFDPGGLVVVPASHEGVRKKAEDMRRLHHPRRRLLHLHFLW
jgi:hypothetical protein